MCILYVLSKPADGKTEEKGTYMDLAQNSYYKQYAANCE